MSNSLNPDQAQHIVEPDPGPNFLKRLAIDDRKSSLASKGLTFETKYRFYVENQKIVSALYFFICC